MNGMTCQNQKGHHHSNRMNNKKRLNQDQVRLLEASFNYNKKLEPEHKLELAKQLGVPPRQIAIWYQNKRARWKNQSLELDYGVLQLRLETALSEKKQLEKQVQYLQDELHKAQETLLSVRQQEDDNDDDHIPPVSSNFSDCCDDGGGGGGTSGCSWETGDQGLKLEEIYACLMGAAKGISSKGQNEKLSFF